MSSFRFRGQSRQSLVTFYYPEGVNSVNYVNYFISDVLRLHVSLFDVVDVVFFCRLIKQDISLIILMISFYNVSGVS